ncbi:MAG: RNA polymerase sigma factor [Anaerolineae bacterium]
MAEETLIQRWRDGETDAFDELYQRHAAAIYRLGWSMLRQPQAAEDVVQETFLRAYRARRRFDPRQASFGTWLYQIALNYCRSQLRRKRLLTIPWPWLSRSEAGAAVSSARPGPETAFLRNEYRLSLWEAVQGLSEPLREVVVLHYYLEIPAVEIAALLDCPVGTVYSRLHNARRRLADTLARRGLVPHTPEAQNAP